MTRLQTEDTSLPQAEPDLQPAENFPDAIQRFNPRLALDDKEIEHFYQDRDARACADMLSSLKSDLHSRTASPVKLLFSGHRGSGKTTELNRFCQKLTDKFYIVKVSLDEMISPTQASYVDVLLCASVALYKQAVTEEAIGNAPRDIVAGLFKRTSDFFSRAWKGSAPPEIPAVNARFSTEFGAFFTKLQLEYRTQSPTRNEVRENAINRLSDVIVNIDDLSAQVRDITRKPVLFVFDDTDKPEPEKAKQVFFDHANELTSFKASAIYTFPIELAYTQEFVTFGQKFDDCHRLPNWKIATRDGVTHEPVMASLRELINRRIKKELIEPQACDALIRASGGHTRSLMQLLRSASVRADQKTGPNARIEMAEAEAAIGKLRGDFLGTLETQQYEWLAERRKDKTLSRDEHTQGLLYSLALLEYDTPDPWCDVHPVVLPLLEQRTAHQTK